VIVDDVDSNIYVAKGLMAPYELNIDSADRGIAAIEKIKNGNMYDIIFMDHMMPEMDGIETTKRIRALGYTEPIVALTASAVAGQVDMFLSNGFDDYISKPIDIRQMNVVMNKYVRDKQPPEVLDAVRRFKENEEKRKDSLSHLSNPENAGFTKLKDKEIPGLDIDRGLERYHGDEDAYLRVLNSYSIAVRDMLGYIETVDKDKLGDYKIKAHGIKGACFDVFADELADKAKALEDAANDGDFEYIRNNNSPFIEVTRELLDRIDSMLAYISAENTDAKSKPKRDKIDSESLENLVSACKDYDMSSVDRAMEEIELYEYDSDKELAAWLRENVDLINFADIIYRVSGG